MSEWIRVSERLPRCKRDVNSAGTPVLIWPRNPMFHESDAIDGFCYYGKRTTGYATFYLFGAEITGVTHWMPLPEPPK